MTVRRALMVAGLFVVVGLLSKPATADTITNGNFQTGTLAGWTVFTTPNGTNGGGLPGVVSFNTTGGGASDAALFNVGEVVLNSTSQGGGLLQMITAPVSGLYTFTEDFASQNDASGLMNEDAGTFSFIIDGTTVATQNLGGFSTIFQILRGSFDGSVNLTAGSHTVETLITRTFLSGGINTPEEYLDNISLTPNAVTATPEPSSLYLLGTGALGLAGMARRKFLSRS